MFTARDVSSNIRFLASLASCNVPRSPVFMLFLFDPIRCPSAIASIMLCWWIRLASDLALPLDCRVSCASR
ncbi:uncharacterized protein SCHCODRAFT_01270904 [Schizophyllum commune H4-8]|uniref:uncharacterized protein n=1 Tax=Schizophyllum commune (strain H4-8 / FGSC 9210) TaxID=578458 RepID=UPI00215F07B2|nr:uncharacterized protein SCHCODRAFT_01270904 [Schizophyllum commune H4-8]KAI5899805.1 hypothetical protein SCHCODRAFT_01270904 [Schizophyllum commune H4-8]